MDQTYTVPCSNCGAQAIRKHFSNQVTKYTFCPENRIIQTECPNCDSLLIMCALNGNVVEAYVSSTSVFTREQTLNNSPLAIPKNTDSKMSCLTTLSV